MGTVGAAKAVPTRAGGRSGTDVAERVRTIIDDVRTRGDAAVREYSARFDGWEPERFRLSPEQVAELVASLPAQVVDDIARPFRHPGAVRRPSNGHICSVTMTVLMNAGPWLAVPPHGYGGIENVVAALVPELRRRGVRVVLAGVGSSELPVDELVSVYPDGQFAQLQRPFNRVMGVAAAHLHRVVCEVRSRDDITLVHDHQEAFGLTVLAAMGADAPPVLHTLHWDLAKHPELYGNVDGGGRLFVNGVSFNQLTTAPPALRALSVGHVHLATPLAVRADRRPAPPKAGHLVTLGRITPCKGQHIAARVAHRIGRDLVLAGPVGPHHTPDQLAAVGPDDPNPDVRYWREHVEPLVDGRRVRWLGTVVAGARDELVASAAAALLPIEWEEPGGTAVVESLALGTPVVGFRRGCLPELVEHGRTGLLVEPGDEEALAAAVGEAARHDPDEGRRDAARRFTPARMAERYLRLYQRVLAAARNGGTHRLSRAGSTG
nr:glycosyltransferase [Pseudonocardia nigra]